MHKNLVQSASRFERYLVIILFVANHQSCFSQFVSWIFLSLSSWKRKQTFHWSKTEKNMFWTNKNIVFFFNCSNWEKIADEIGENKISCLVVWCHEQDKCPNFEADCTKSENPNFNLKTWNSTTLFTIPFQVPRGSNVSVTQPWQLWPMETHVT